MGEMEITVRYREYSSAQELPDGYRKLLDMAAEATAASYAPYSKFNVGAAVLMGNGEIVTGSNQENAASPSGLCAERVALLAAHHRWPGVPVKAIAIAAKTGGILTKEPTYPCAACVQVMLESQMRSGNSIEVIAGSAKNIHVIPSINDLLPFSFSNLPGQKG